MEKHLGQGLFYFHYRSPLIPVPFVEQTIFPSLNFFRTFVNNQLGIFLYVYFGVLESVLLISVCIPLSVLHSLTYCSYTTSIEIGYTTSIEIG